MSAFMSANGRASKTAKGLACPVCRHVGSEVVDSRSNLDHTRVRRRRECDACGERWTTYEVHEAMLVVAVPQCSDAEMLRRIAGRMERK